MTSFHNFRLTILSLLQWFGEGEKYVKAVFSLASKIAPSVVFVDEVSSIPFYTLACLYTFMLNILNFCFFTWSFYRLTACWAGGKIQGSMRPCGK